MPRLTLSANPSALSGSWHNTCLNKKRAQKESREAELDKYLSRQFAPPMDFSGRLCMVVNLRHRLRDVGKRARVGPGRDLSRGPEPFPACSQEGLV